MENQEEPNQETQEKWSKDPENWIWGIFYYNKEDNRLLVDKRNPNLGGTIILLIQNPIYF